MKKTIMAVVLVLSMLWLSGCGATQPTKGPAQAGGDKATGGDKAAADTKSGPIKVTLVGGSVGGSWSAMGEGVGELIRRVAPGSSYGYQPGQDGANAITVNSGQAQLGFLFSSMAKSAYEGMEPYKEKLNDLRSIATFGPLILHGIASEKSGIKSYSDLKNKKVVLAMNTKGSTQEILSRALLAEHGVTYEDIEKNGGKILYLSADAGRDQMKDGRADMRIGINITPDPKVADEATTNKIVLVQPDSAAIKKIVDKYVLSAVTIPKSTYTFMTADVPSFEIPLTIVASKNLPDNVAYTVAKALVEQFDYLKTLVPAQLAKDTTQTMVKNPIPVHPGAEKYYKEKGLIK